MQGGSPHALVNCLWLLEHREGVVLACSSEVYFSCIVCRTLITDTGTLQEHTLLSL